MNMMNLRRRMLMDLLRKLVIFNTTLRAGEIIDSSYSEINLDSGCIDVKGERVAENEYIDLSTADYTEAGAIAYVEDVLGGHNVKSGVTINSSGDEVYRVFYDVYRSYFGYIEIGSYNFTKYNMLKFTVTNYSGSGSIAFGDVSEPITADGEYSINIENYEGNFNIKFNSDDVSGYSVNNIYLENI